MFSRAPDVFKLASTARGIEVALTKTSHCQIAATARLLHKKIDEEPLMSPLLRSTDRVSQTIGSQQGLPLWSAGDVLHHPLASR